MTYRDYIKKAIIDTIEDIDDESTLMKLYSMIMVSVNPDDPTSKDNCV